jgi:hypothetical protein
MTYTMRVHTFVQQPQGYVSSHIVFGSLGPGPLTPDSSATAPAATAPPTPLFVVLYRQSLEVLSYRDMLNC